MSYSARYAAGEHEAVWRDMDRAWAEYGEQVTADGPWLRHYTVDRDDAEDVMRQTFERVARNVDRLIEGLRETGYRFECEAGRYAEPRLPQRPAQKDLASIQTHLEEEFGDLDIYGPGLPPLPPAIRAFGEHVGSVDLRQRFWAPIPDEWKGDVPPDAALAEQLFELANPGKAPVSGLDLKEVQKFIETMRSALPQPSQQEIERRLKVNEEDNLPHPNADDAVLAHLGDWDPVCFEVESILFDLTNGDREPWVLPEGVLAWEAEFAPSFEHKVNVSGAVNYSMRFPVVALDPVINSEGISLPFTTYLRRCFARGGFFGTPRPFFRAREFTPENGGYLDKADWLPMSEVQPGFWLPDHPIFAQLAGSFEPF